MLDDTQQRYVIKLLETLVFNSYIGILEKEAYLKGLYAEVTMPGKPIVLDEPVVPEEILPKVVFRKKK